MENFLENINAQLNINEFLSFFSSELFCIIGMLVNILIFLFLRKKLNVKRVSNFVTIGVFIINSIILLSIYITNSILFENVKFGTFNNFLFFDDESILIKLLINIFAIFFILITYKLSAKVHAKGAILNAILLALVLCSGLMVQSENPVLTYLLLEINLLLVYRYASNMRIRKIEPFSRSYIIYGVSASILVALFYLLSLRASDSTRLSIIQTGLCCAILLKAGIFPIYNYLIERHYKKNIQFSILQFCYVPFVSSVAFMKILDSMNLLDEAFQVSMFIFLLSVLFCNSISTIKSKNLNKLFANAAYCFSSIAIMNCLFLNDNNLSLKFISLSAFCLLGIYSLLCVLKINLKIDKINIRTLRGMFLNNKTYSLLLSLQLLFLCGVLPSGVSLYGLKILYSAYLFDKVGVFSLCAIIFALIPIIFAMLNIIQNIYAFDKKEAVQCLTKKTAVNYFISLIIIIFLVINMFV